MTIAHRMTSNHKQLQGIDQTTSQSILVDSSQAFARLLPSGRTIRAYSGSLPCTRYAARHLLKCEHLQPIPGEQFPPYRAEPNNTHQLWIWYRFKTNPDQLHLLFREQFGFEIPGKKSNQIAGEITRKR